MDWKALGYGLATFLTGWALMAIVASAVATTGTNATGYTAFQVMGYLVPVVAGYVAAMISTRRRLVHGVVGGAIGVVPVIFFPMLFADLTYSTYGVLVVVICYTVLAALGAVFGDHVAKRRAG